MSRLSAKEAKEAASTAAAEAPRMVGQARDFLAPHLTTARDSVGPAIGHARETVLPAIGHARETVLPALEHARKAMEDTLKADVLPRVAAGIAATEPAREEAMRRGTAAIAALRGQVEEAPAPTGGRRIGKLLIITACGAAAVAAWRVWRRPNDGEDWVNADSYTSGATPGTGTDAPATDATGTDASAANGHRAAHAAGRH